MKTKLTGSRKFLFLRTFYNVYVAIVYKFDFSLFLCTGRWLMDNNVKPHLHTSHKTSNEYSCMHKCGAYVCGMHTYGLMEKNGFEVPEGGGG